MVIASTFSSSFFRITYSFTVSFLYVQKGILMLIINANYYINKKQFYFLCVVLHRVKAFSLELFLNYPIFKTILWNRDKLLSLFLYGEKLGKTPSSKGRKNNNFLSLFSVSIDRLNIDKTSTNLQITHEHKVSELFLISMHRQLTQNQ